MFLPWSIEYFIDPNELLTGSCPAFDKKMCPALPGTVLITPKYCALAPIFGDDWIVHVVPPLTHLTTASPATPSFQLYR